MTTRSSDCWERTFLFITNYPPVKYFVGVFSFAKIFFVGVPFEDTIAIELIKAFNEEEMS